MDDAGRCGAPSLLALGRLASSTFLLFALGCGPVRNAVHAVTPTAPPSAGSACPAVPWRCTDGVPERCEHDHFNMTHPDTNWRSVIEHAEKIGLGNREYELIKL